MATSGPDQPTDSRTLNRRQEPMPIEGMLQLMHYQSCMFESLWSAGPIATSIESHLHCFTSCSNLTVYGCDFSIGVGMCHGLRGPEGIKFS